MRFIRPNMSKVPPRRGINSAQVLPQRRPQLPKSRSNHLGKLIVAGTVSAALLGNEPGHAQAAITASNASSVVFQWLSIAAVDRTLPNPIQLSRVWFYRNRKALRVEYRDLYIAVLDDKVIDSDKNLARLTNRVLSVRGPVDAYFGYVGDEPPTILASVIR